MKAKRNGRTFNHTVMSCPNHVMLTLGFTKEQADRMIQIRRILPFDGRRTTPCIDARKLWERIGKPEAKFSNWIARGASEVFHRFVKKSEVLERLVSTKGRPRIEYTISRDCAAHLAMRADTPEGDSVRDYFLDMEELAMKLIQYTPIRGSMLTNIDKQVSHQAFIKAGNRVKAGDIQKGLIKQEALHTERKLKSMVCQVMTRHSASEWKGKVGRSIRDTVCPEDLNQYTRAYDSGLTLLTAGMPLEEIERILSTSFADCIQVEDYLTERLEVA